MIVEGIDLKHVQSLRQQISIEEFEKLSFFPKILLLFDFK